MFNITNPFQKRLVLQKSILLRNPKNLKSTWQALTSTYTDKLEMIEEVWQEIERAYTKSNRHYHNLSHLEFMINKAVRYKHKIKDFDSILFSIFYHDIFHNIKRQDNEKKSAEIATDRLNKLGVPSDKILVCKDQIMATKEHKRNASQDTNFLLDFDLAILGDSPEIYKAYIMKIRKEYAMYPDFLYKMGRKKVIQHFLNMPSIFKTEEFLNNYEQQATENLKAELDGF